MAVLGYCGKSVNTCVGDRDGRHMLAGVEVGLSFKGRIDHFRVREIMQCELSGWALGLPLLAGVSLVHERRRCCAVSGFPLNRSSAGRRTVRLLRSHMDVPADGPQSRSKYSG